MTIALAAAIGAMLRFALESHLNKMWHLGTIIANLAGSFILGFAISHHLATEVTVFCGAFTTFGGFIGQTFLDKTNHHKYLYITVTVIGSVTMAWIGLKLG